MASTVVDIEALIAQGESLTVEFKGESMAKLSDRDIYEVVVCFANSDGGTLLIGVENDGRITGAQPRHDGGVDPDRLRAAIFNNTVPKINTRISVHQISGVPVVAVEVDSYPEVCATQDGRALRRNMALHGPECVPFYPHEHISRRGDLGLVDYSALLADGFGWDAFDPLEFERLRQTIRRRRGDQALLPLSDRELVQALQLVETHNEALVPNLAGLLLLGREDVLRRTLRSHEIAFQVLDANHRVLVNDWFHGPLLKTLETIEERFNARNPEQEILSGLYRVPIPAYNADAFREAVNNAVLHRDYSQLGTIFIQFQADDLFIANPGGFLGGITLDNLLVHEPKPRNPCLAQAIRRIGLVETTGRGIDLIYIGQLRYGRPLPDYSRSDSTGVRLVLRGSGASPEFTKFVAEEMDISDRAALQEMIALNLLLDVRRVIAAEVAAAIQQSETEARSVLERLVERGWVEASNSLRSRSYQLSAVLYRRLEARASYVRMRGFDPIRQEAMVMEYLAAYETITRREVIELCGIEARQANYLLETLVGKQSLRLVGKGRGAHYVRGAGKQGA